jgi:hypothetical protein
MAQHKIPSIQTILSFLPSDDLLSCLVKPDSPTPEPDESASADQPNLVVHGSWQSSEDDQLRDAVAQYGINHWDSVSSLIPGRNPIQCRERWIFRISPGLNKGHFEPWEDDLIFRERTRVGNHWTLIAGKLPGRTSCAVKNRWYSALRWRMKSSVVNDNILSINSLLSQQPTFRTFC